MSPLADIVEEEEIDREAVLEEVKVQLQATPPGTHLWLIFLICPANSMNIIVLVGL